MENHTMVLSLIRLYGESWTNDDNLSEICHMLDDQGVPIPKTWPVRADSIPRSWTRALENYPHLVIKAIKDRLKAARA